MNPEAGEAARWPGRFYPYPGKCEECGKELPQDEVTFGPNPFEHEVHDDDTPEWLCEDCRRELARDV